LNLFHARDTKFLLGTLHHSGLRPAPPSEHIPLARRSAFLRTENEPCRRNLAARAGFESWQQSHSSADGTMKLCGSASVIRQVTP
jgi:hypothetical protein